MSKEYQFLRECGVFWVTTSTVDRPSSRPFGAVMLHNELLYISTNRKKDVYRELKANSNIQITALKAETREWIRIAGNAEETSILAEKEAMLIECPVLKRHFTTADCVDFAVFKIIISKVDFL